MIKSSSGTLSKGEDSAEMKKSNSAVKVGKLKHSQTIVINNNSKDMPQIKTARMLTSQRSLPVEIGEPFEESPLPKAGNKKIVKELTKSTSVEVNQLKKEKVSKVVRGHLMAVRDKRRATIMQNHLYSLHYPCADPKILLAKCNNNILYTTPGWSNPLVVSWIILD